MDKMMRSTIILILMSMNLDITAATEVDVVLSGFEYRLSGAKLYQDQDIRVHFNFEIENVATVEGCCAINGAVIPDANFLPTLLITDSDLGIPVADTLGLQPNEVSLSQSETEALSNGLLDRESITFSSGVSTVNVPSASCDDVRYLCLRIAKGAGATYGTENSDTNNYQCHDISSLMGCTTDVVDLSVPYFEVVDHIVHRGHALSLNFRVGVSLQGSRMLTPDASTGSDVYEVKLFLSLNDVLEIDTDVELVEKPLSFSLLSTSLSSSGVLDLSGPGLMVPEGLDPSFCGPVYLIMYLDGITSPGNIEEINEDNNVDTAKVVVKCNGDAIAVTDFRYDLGPLQSKLYPKTNTPVWVTAGVYNVMDEQSFKPGPANYQLTLWLSTTPGVQAGLYIRVSQHGVRYFDSLDPLQAVPSGGRSTVSAVFWVDSSKFVNNVPGYKYLVLKVELPVDWTGPAETVTSNNAMAQPVEISPIFPSAQVDYLFIDEFHIRQRVDADKYIAANVLLVSDVDNANTPLGGDTLSFDGYVDLAGGTSTSMITKLHWSKDDKYDENDLDSQIILQLQTILPHFVKVTPGSESSLTIPADKSYCGAIWGIVHFKRTASQSEDNEKLKYNNFGMDVVVLRCHVDDSLGLTDVKLVDPPIIYAGVATPVTLEVTVSCTGDSAFCNSLTTSQVNFQLKLHLENDNMLPSIELLGLIDDNANADAFSGTGVQSALTIGKQRRATFTITKTITVSSAQCQEANKYLGVQLLKADGSEDGYADNDFTTLELPKMSCSVSSPKIDLAVSTFIVSAGASSLAAGTPLPFTLGVTITLDNGRKLSATQWPHCNIAFYISGDTILDADDILIPYRLTECQRFTLTKEYSATTTITLDDPDGLYLHPQTLNKICTGSYSPYYIGVHIDSFESDGGNSRRGQIDEFLETNNVAWSSHDTLTGVDCSDFTQNTKLLDLKEAKTVNMPSFIREEVNLDFTLRVAVTNKAKSPIRGGTTGNKDYEIKVFLSEGTTKTGEWQELRVSLVDAESVKLYQGMEEGGTVIIEINAQLCAAPVSGCAPENVLLLSDCSAIQAGSPHLLVELDNLRSTLVDDGYTIGEPLVLPVNLHCGPTLTPVIQEYSMSSKLANGAHLFSLYFTILVHNYNKDDVSSSFQTNNDNFELELSLLDEGAGESVSLSVPDFTDSGYRQVIPSDDNVTLQGTATFDISNNECNGWNSAGSVYLKAEVVGIHNQLKNTHGYTGQSNVVLTTSTVVCNDAYVDLGVKSFTLLQDADGTTEDTAVTLGVPKKFDLSLLITPSGGNVLPDKTSTPDRNYQIRFYISDDNIWDAGDHPVPEVFGPGYDPVLKGAVNAQVTEYLNWNSLTPVPAQSSLVIDDYSGGPHCLDTQVYLVVKVGHLGNIVDPDDSNDKLAYLITLNCPGDVYYAHDVLGLQTQLFVDDNLLLSFDMSISNSNPDNIDIPAGKDKSNNFILQLNYFIGEFASTAGIRQIAQTDIKMDDGKVLREGIPVGGTLNITGVQVKATIDDTVCDAIQENGMLQILAQYSVGMDESLVDRVNGNDGVTMRGISCSKNTADLSVASFNILGTVTNVITVELTPLLRLKGTHTYTGGGQHYVYKYLLSNDSVFDQWDKELEFTDFSAQPDCVIVNGLKECAPTYTDTIAVPADYIVDYCGRPYLIVVLDTADLIQEADELNNVKATEIFMPACPNDIYDLEDVQFRYQNRFYADRQATIEFDAKVFNVHSQAINAPSGTKFNLKLFAQLGKEFLRSRVVDITPAWVYTRPTDVDHFTVNHESLSAKEFSGVRGVVILTTALCVMGVDHLTIAVIPVEALGECIVNNNYHSIPIECLINDNVDVYVTRDRTDQPVFRLQSDNNIILGADKKFEMEMSIDITGQAGWSDRTGEADPVFTYSMLLTDGVTSIMVPTPDKKELINKATVSSVVLDFGGTINLDPSTFLPLCTSGLSLVVDVDPENKLEESNEGNNRVVLTGVVVTDGGSGMCSSKLDLSITDFQLSPPPKQLLVATTPPTPFEYTMTFVITKAPNSGASDPTSFKYQLVMSHTADSNDPYLTVVLQSEVTVTDMTTKTVTGTSSIKVDAVQDRPMQHFCARKPYLGVWIDFEDDVDEVSNDNNYIWTPIVLQCPHLQALSLISFYGTATDRYNAIQDSVPTVLSFTMSILNKGGDIPANGAGDNFVLKAILNSEANVSGGTHLTGAVFAGLDIPLPSSAIKTRQIITYNTSTVTLTLPSDACLGSTHLCLEVEPGPGVEDLFRDDNFQCIDIINGNIGLDCVRDISIEPGTASVTPLAPLVEVYQDTVAQIAFSAEIHFVGRAILGDGTSSYIGFEFYLSDIDSITPTALNGGSSFLISSSFEFDSVSKAIFNGDLKDGNNYVANGTAEIFITSEACAAIDRFICVKYMMARSLLPPLRDQNSDNDYQCVDVSGMFGCHANTRDLEPVWLNFVDDNHIRVDEDAMFDLQVKVEVRADGNNITKQPIKFESTFHLSTNPTLDEDDTLITYAGFSYFMAEQEMERPLGLGDHVLNLGGVPLRIPSAVDNKYCGQSYIIYTADTGSLSVDERYENNNVYSKAVILHCLGDQLMMTSLSIDIRSPLTPGYNTTFWMDLTIVNVGIDIPMSASMDPSYTLRIYASDSPVFHEGTHIGITKAGAVKFTSEFDTNQPLPSGKALSFERVQVSTSGASFTQIQCQSTTHLLVCVEVGAGFTDNVTTNNCKTHILTLGQTDCSDSQSMRDIEMLQITAPGSLSSPGTVDVRHDIRITIGVGSLAVTSGQFISSAYLSKDKFLDKLLDLKILEVQNSIDQAPGSVRVHTIEQTAGSVVELTDKSLCGNVYILIQVDSEDDIQEVDEHNNVAFKQVVVLCNSDFFSISNPTLLILDGHLVSGGSMWFDLWTDITCSRGTCDIDVATDNVKLKLSSAADGAPLVELASITSDWTANGMLATPSLGSSFLTPFQTRRFHIAGTLNIPAGHCGSTGSHRVVIEVDLGASLTGTTDGVGENNIVTIPYLCVNGTSRDLVANQLLFLGGDTLSHKKRAKFSLQIDLIGDALPPTDTSPPAAPFTFALYISDDATLSEDDVRLSYQLTESTAGDLNKGIPADSSLTLIEFVEGVELPFGHCGRQYIIVYIDDTNKIDDSVKSNNIAYREVYIDCETDVYAVEALWTRLPAHVFHNTPVELNFALSVGNVGQHDTMSYGGKSPLTPFVALTADYQRTSLPHNTLTNISVHPETQALLSQGIKAGEIITYVGFSVELIVDSNKCSDYKYLMFGVLPDYNSPRLETYLDNNYEVRPINIVCTDAVDIAVTNFGVAGNLVKGQNRDFTLTVTAVVPSDGEMAPFSYSFWLSTDKTLERTHDVPLSVVIAPGMPFADPLTASIPSLDISGTGDNGVHIPSSLPDFLCGKVYLLVQIDSDYEVMESDEDNNLGFTEVVLECENDLFSVVDLNVTSGSLPALPDVVLPLYLDFKLACIKTDSSCPSAPANPNQVHYTFDIKVYEEGGYEVGAMNPMSIDPTWIASQEGVEEAGISPANALALDFSDITKEYAISISGGFLLGTIEVCSRIRYIGIQVIKGDSDELSPLAMGPDSSNRRMVPFTFKCRTEFADIWVTSFTLPSGPNVDISDGIINFQLNVQTSASNQPPNTLRKPIFSYKISASDDGLLSDDDVDLGYTPPANIESMLRVEFESYPSLDLSDMAFSVSPEQIAHLCGLPDSHLILQLDPANAVDETDESNNIATTPITISGCNNGFDLKVTWFQSPSVVVSGQEIDSLVNVSVVIIGGLSLPIGLVEESTAYSKYTLSFSLLDNIKNPLEVHTIEFDTTELNELTEPLQADSLELNQSGVASVIHRSHHGPPLRIPTDYVYCGRSWYLEARVDLNQTYSLVPDLWPEDNSLYKYIHIICPSDHLALLNYQIEYQPEVWRSESVNHIDFYISAINYGDRIEKGTTNYIFAIEQYFSLDSVLDGSDIRQTVKMAGNYDYDYREASMASGQVVTSPLVSGQLNLDSMITCDAAVAQNAEPTLFWKLVPGDPDDSAYIDNDIMKFPLDKKIFKCEQANVDLKVTQLTLDGDNIIHAGLVKGYGLTISQTKTEYGRIDASLGEELSYRFDFYLSKNDKLDVDTDAKLDIAFSEDQLSTMRGGVLPDTDSDIDLRGNNLLVDLETRPDLGFYCGSVYLITTVTDLMNAGDLDPVMDPVLDNNILVYATTLLCNQDVISFEKLSMRPNPPQEQLFGFHPAEFTFMAEVKNYAVTDIIGSLDRPVITFRAFLSQNQRLEVLTDPEISMAIPVSLTDDTKRGIPAGGARSYMASVNLTADLSVCTYQPKYIVILAQKGAHLNLEEIVIGNNYLSINFQEYLNCTLSTSDAMIKSFIIPSTSMSPGEEISFELTIEVSSSIGPAPGIEYQFYLSKDIRVDRDDTSLQYSMQDHVAMLEGLHEQNALFQLDSVTENIVIPANVDAKYCGNSYLIVYADNNESLRETNELNNMLASPIVLNCYQDMYELGVSFINLQDEYFMAPGTLHISFTVYNRLGETIPEDVLYPPFVLKAYVSSTPDFEHDITPNEWLDKLQQPLLTTQEFSEGSSMDFEFISGVIDVSPACQADIYPLQTGMHNLSLRVMKGPNPALHLKYDAVPNNDVYTTAIQINCGAAYLDLNQKDGTFVLQGDDVLNLGPNPFDLTIVVSVDATNAGGWPLMPSLPESPMMFQYEFTMKAMMAREIQMEDPDPNIRIPVLYNKVIDYDIEGMKARINAETRDGISIDLSDSGNGLELKKEDYLYLCLADTDQIPLSIEVAIDSLHEKTETEESNNLGLAIVRKPEGLDCQSDQDFSIWMWSVSGAQYDIVKVGQAYRYNLQIAAVLVDTALDGLEGTSYTHFDIEIFLSNDRVRDDSDLAIPITLSNEQVAELQRHALGFDLLTLDFLGLAIPLTPDVYAFCWRTIYIGVMADVTDKKQEVNENNNAAFYAIILDCGDEVDECSLGLDNCDINAECVDSVYHLYSESGQGFTCQCRAGFRGDGAICQNIDECTEVDPLTSAPLHDCGTMSNALCQDNNGSFSCVCMNGYTQNLDGNCEDTNECLDTSSILCHLDADCTNTLGSYTCQCKPGFVGDGIACTNVDDCTPTSCNLRGQCEDAVQGVICDCEEHYEGEQCEVANGNWGLWGGWSTCQADCGDGTQYRERACNSPAPSNGGRICVSINGTGAREERWCNNGPCQGGIDWCASDPCNTAMGGQCFMTNQGQSYTCNCIEGYKKLMENGLFIRCDDVDECSEVDEGGTRLHACHLLATCENTIGSYRCHCNAKYTGNGLFCQDLDECNGEHQCDTNADCINVGGGYLCDCREGFKQEKLGDPITGECIVDRLFPYGLDAGDTLVTTKSSVTGERISDLIYVPHGLPVAGENVLNSLFVSENGVIIGTADRVKGMNRKSYRTPERLSKSSLVGLSGLDRAIIAPFWADSETEEEISKVWYRSFSDSTAGGPLFSQVSSAIQATTGDVIVPQFVLMCTWQKMRPHYTAESTEMNTFQAVVATDYVKSYALYLYDNGQMTWNPVYSADDIQLIYDQGYPARIGFSVMEPDGSFYYGETDNSGKWSTNPGMPNAYRADRARLQPGHDSSGTAVFRLDNNGPSYSNPRKACVDWYQAEGDVQSWGAYLVGNCPAMKEQVVEDYRFFPESSLTLNGDQCYNLLFPYHTGASIRCCYKENSDTLLTATEFNGGTSLSNMSLVGFVSRYPQSDESSSDHMLKDVAPFDWCCVQANGPNDDYCNMYTNRRPISASYNYDKLSLGLCHGDPHFTSLDGVDFTFNGFGEYILLRSKLSSPVYVMIQGRTSTINQLSPSATFFSAIAMQVGSDTAEKVEAYLKADEADLDVYIDGVLMAGTLAQDENIKVELIETSPKGVRIISKQGLFMELTAAQSGSRIMLKTIIFMPTSLQTNGFEGILGNFNGNPADDLTPRGGAQYDINTVTQDGLYAFANSWSLRMTYGQSVTGSSANTKTLFTKYSEYTGGLYNSAIDYYDVGYSPQFFEKTDFTSQEQLDCTSVGDAEPSYECLYDSKLLDDLDAGLSAINSRKMFERLKGLLNNGAPQYTSPTPSMVTVTVGQSVTIPIHAVDEPGEELTFRASVINSAGEEQLSNTLLQGTETPASSQAEYTATLNWSPGVRDTYILHITVTDSHGAASVIKPKLVLCACENGGICDFSVPVSQTGTFAYASCQCTASWSGQFCNEDYDGCSTAPCYGSCDDRTPIDVAASVDRKEYECSPCPSAMDGDGETCSDLNECLLSVNYTSRHRCGQVCVNSPGGYYCECNKGYQLANDLVTCEDIPECKSADKNNCDLEAGYCLDDEPGSFTCYCNPGYAQNLASTVHNCVDMDECLNNNGGCQRQCVNTPGSFYCECGQGYKVHDTNPFMCVEINECNLEPACDQLCYDRIGYYLCGCRTGFSLETDEKRCKPLTTCIHKVCDTLAYCGLLTDGSEQCYCPRGYQLDPVGKTRCDDIDECSTGIHYCNEYAVCFNTRGNYECICPEGFQFKSGDNRRCDNIDECSLGPAVHKCQQKCVDTVGSFACKCHQGYLLAPDGQNCIDIDECLAGQDNECSEEAECENQPGYYVCSCRTGFTGTGFVCTDINECLINNGGCESACVNTHGSYQCSCVRGYILDPTDDTKCIDVDECGTPLDDCHHRCVNVMGSFRCECDTEFTLIRGHQCEPINACEEQCGGGSCYVEDFTQKCHCNAGYEKYAGDLDECLNRNECKLGTDLCDKETHARCVDTEGSYKCTCDIGFTINNDNITCTDLDECNAEEVNLRHRCDETSSYCVNTDGDYQCRCKNGFVQTAEGTCQDINECDDRRFHDCDRRATCVNTPGSYLCQCRSGYTGGGRKCQDIDECVDQLANTCSQTERCENNNGSFICVCKTGYKRNQYGECVDIDECASPILNTCEFSTGCVNLPGKFRCSCYEGAVLDNDGISCTPLQRCSNKTKCDQRCMKIQGIDTCMCSYPLDSKCKDIDECALKDMYGLPKSPCDLAHSICINKSPFFECKCKQHWIPDKDGLGCSETNGSYSEWSEWSPCSRICNGRVERNRKCDNPASVGQGRKCQGPYVEYQLCNDDLAECRVQTGEVEAGVMITYHSLAPEMWDTIESPILQAISNQVNKYCTISSGTFEKCCGYKASLGTVPRKDIVAAKDIVVAKGYPRGHDAGSRVMMFVQLPVNNALCPNPMDQPKTLDEDTGSDGIGGQQVTSRKKRSVLKDEAMMLSRRRRASDTNASDFVYLSQETFNIIMNLNDTNKAIAEELLYLDLDSWLAVVMNHSLKAGFLEVDTTVAPTPSPTAKPPPLPLWAIIIIGVVGGLLLILFIIIICIICKRNENNNTRQVSPKSSQASLKRHEILEHEKGYPEYISDSEENFNGRNHPVYMEGPPVSPAGSASVTIGDVKMACPSSTTSNMSTPQGTSASLKREVSVASLGREASSTSLGNGRDWSSGRSPLPSVESPPPPTSPTPPLPKKKPKRVRKHKADKK